MYAGWCGSLSYGVEFVRSGGGHGRRGRRFGGLPGRKGEGRREMIGVGHPERTCEGDRGRRCGQGRLVVGNGRGRRGYGCQVVGCL